METAHSVENLLSHEAFVRRVARRLVADADTVDDLVQETWMAAAARPPVDRGQPRAWLVRVVRNLAAKQRRRAQLRGTEVLGEDAPDGLSPYELALAAEVRRILHESMLQLDPRYVRVLRLRFFEGLRTAEVARVLSLPEETVRTRQRRALAQLRERLDGKLGPYDRRRGLALIGLLRHPASPAPAVALGRLAALFAMASAAAVLIVLGLHPDGPPERALHAGSALRVAGGRPSAIAVAPRSSASSGSRRVAAVTVRAPRLDVAVRGETAGAPVAGVDVAVEWAGDGAPHAAPAAVCTDADGEAAFPDLVDGPWRVWTARGAPVLVFLEPGRDERLELRVPDGEGLSVEVVDVRGTRVAGARVEARPAGGHLPRRALGVTGPDGRLRVPPLAAGTALLASGDGDRCQDELLVPFGWDGSHPCARCSRRRRGTGSACGCWTRRGTPSRGPRSTASGTGRGSVWGATR